LSVCTLINRRPLFIAAALLALLVTSLSASAAPAGVAERRQQAQAARAEMVRLGEELTPAIERYNQAVAQLEQVEAEIAFNKRQINVTKDNLDVTQDELHEQLEQSYRVGSPDLLSSVLSQTSISQVLAVADLFARSQNQSANLVEGLRRDRQSLARRQRALDSAQDEAKALRAARAEQQRTIEAGIAEQQALVAGLEDEIAALIEEEQARQERIRQQALAALAAQESAAQGGAGFDDIAIGGSVDGGASGDSASASSEPAAAPIELPPTDGSLGAQAVAAALQHLGVPYVWGGASPSGFDCSGLTQYAYGQVGISLTHFTGSQWNEGVRVPADQLLPGDLVFFRSDLGHMGMYMGNGQYINAPQTGDVVKISSLADRSDYQGAVRPY
jgi:cell wall-associated NlpC family hydrolase